MRQLQIINDLWRWLQNGEAAELAEKKNERKCGKRMERKMQIVLQSANEKTVRVGICH